MYTTCVQCPLRKEGPDSLEQGLHMVNDHHMGVGQLNLDPLGEQPLQPGLITAPELGGELAV